MAVTTEWRVGQQEPQGSSPGFECAGSDSDRRVPAELGSDIESIGLIKKYVQVFLHHLLEKPEQTFWPTQYTELFP